MVPAVLLLAALLSGGRAAFPKSVLVIVLDDVGLPDLQDVSALGGTPNIDALAARGVYFKCAYANGTCSVSRKSLLFGRYATHDTGPQCPADSTEGLDRPTLDDVSMAELVPSFHSAVLGKWHLGESPTGGPFECAPMEHGFDYWLSGTCPGICGQEGYTNWTRIDHCASVVEPGYQPAILSDTFELGWPAVTAPRLCVLAFQLPHAPLHQPARRFLPPGWPTTAFTDKAKYRSMIAAADTFVGRALAVVDEANTLVLLIGDNGPPGAIVPQKGKGTVFERGIHVPLIVAGGPVVDGGRDCLDLTHEVDVYATVAAWVGTGIPAGCDGVSLLPALTNAPHDPPRTTVICGSTIGGAFEECCARSDRLKLRRVGGDPSSDELYDLLADPAEESSVLGQEPYADEQAALQAELSAFLSRQ